MATKAVSDFLAGGGEMGERIRAIDWSTTPLGPSENWPRSLKTAVRIMLTSRQPMFVWWGQDLINLYNDAYKTIVGGRHPEALGQPAATVWREIWDQVGPRAESAMQKNEGTYDEALLLIMERNGYPEETYYTFSYSPVPGDDGSAGGILCANTEDTQRIVEERQLNLLRELAKCAADARTVDEACSLSAKCLQTDAHDLSFSMIYLLDEAQTRASLAGISGIPRDHAAAPAVIDIAAETTWPLVTAIRSRKTCIVTDIQKAFDDLPGGAWKQAPHQAAVVPIFSAGRVGIFIAGLNPFRLFDDRYQRFLDLVAAQIATNIASAQAYDEERKRAQALAELDRAKTLFFSNVSHEFRTPLTLMLGPLNDVLTDTAEDLSPAVRQLVGVAHRNAQRLLKLVNAMLDFSRIEAGRAQAIYEPIDLASTTADLASMFRSTVEKAGMRLIIDCPPLPEPVFVDRDLWEKIVLNLVSNAFKYTLHGEIEVSISTDREARAAILRVRDTGIGIPADEIPKLFNRFHRVEGARGRTQEGTGIGLALVQELAKLHHATLTVDSSLGHGSIFSITVPFGKQHLPAEHLAPRTLASSTLPLKSSPFVDEALGWLPSQTPVEMGDSMHLSSSAFQTDLGVRPHSSGRARVLLADDNTDMRDYVKRLLTPMYEVMTVSDGRQALAAATEYVPDLVVTDVMMPNMDGFSLLEALRAEPRTSAIPIIMLSARAGEEAYIEGRSAGADDYLVKPFSARELLTRIGAQLSLVHLRGKTLAREKTLRAEAEKLNEVARVLTAELDLHQLVQKISDAATELTGARCGAFFYTSIDEEGQIRQHSVLSGEPHPLFNNAGTLRKSPLFLAAMEAKKVLRIDDVLADPRYESVISRNESTGALAPARSYVAVPILSVFGDVVGSLFLGHPQPDAFTAHAERIVQGIAAQAAVAIDNALLYRRARNDIAARAKVEAALRESEQRYRQLILDLPAAIYTCSTDGRLTLFNEAAAALWGRRPTLGHDMWCGSHRIFRPDGKPVPLDQCPMAQMLKTNLPVEPTEIVIERPDGTRRYVIVYPKLLRDESGVVTGAIKMLVDITERKRAEAELARTKDDLGQQVEALTRLHRLSMELTEESEIGPALQVILETLTELHQADFGVISLHAPDSSSLYDVASVGLDQEAPGCLPRNMQAFHVGISAGTSGRPLLSKSRCVVFDTESDPHFKSCLDTTRAIGFRSVHSTPIISRTGEVLGIMSVHFKSCRIPSRRETQFADLCARHATNVIESRLGQQALRESEQRFRHMADHAPVMIWMTDPHLGCIFASKSWCDFTGQTQEQGLGMGWIDAIHPDDREPMLAAFSDARTRREPLRLEYRFRRRDGEYRWALVAGTPRYSEGDFLGYIGSLIDVTGEKEKEAALRVSEQLHRAIGDSIDYGIWISDAKGRYRYVSESFLTLTGTTLEQCAGLDWIDTLHPEDADSTLDAWRDNVRRGEHWDRQYRVRGVDGHWHPILARGVPVRNEGGEVTAWVGINLDISHLKTVEQELREADQRKNEFLATLAHELRNPLAPLLNGIELIKLAKTSSQHIHQARDMMERQLRHMVRLIDDLLDMSRITQGKVELRKARIDLGVVLHNAMETSRSLIESRRQSLLIDLPPSPLIVDADVTRLAQVFGNLLTNAAKYTPEGGHIRVAVDRRDNDVVVSIKDDGVGIPHEMLSSIFDMFTQVDRSLEKIQGGLGIGLTLVKKLVAMHGGTVTAHSEGEGCGSEFVVRLPVVMSVVSDARSGSVEEYSVARTITRRILVADDHDDAASSMAMMLEILGAEVRIARNGSEAVDLAQSFRPQVILMDIGMPELNGYEACRRIRQQPGGKEIIIAALTGWGQNEDKQRSRDAGFDHHLVKPVPLKTIEELLPRRETRAEGMIDATR